jgi:hypothetical protein
MSDQHDTVVVDRGGSGAGVIVAVILVVLLLVGAWYFFLGPGAGSTDKSNDINVNVELPSVAPQSS